MTGYQKIKAQLELWKDYAATLETMLLKMNIPEEVIEKKQMELLFQLYRLEHEKR